LSSAFLQKNITFYPSFRISYKGRQVMRKLKGEEYVVFKMKRNEGQGISRENMINDNDQSAKNASSNKRESSWDNTTAPEGITHSLTEKSMQQPSAQNSGYNNCDIDPFTGLSGPKETIPDQTMSHQLIVDSEAAERQWARELYEMNSDMREAVNYELHGVTSRAIPEDPTVIAEALRLFQIEIDTQISPQQKQTYTRAVVGLKSNYVQTPEFRLRFLRAERFNIKKATIRFCRALDYLVQSFGVQALLRQLFLSDLSKEEERFLKKGFNQILPSRDRFGRRLLTHFGSCGREYPFEVRAKVATYLCFGVLAEDLTTQRNGVVSMAFFSNVDNDLLVRESKGFQQFFEAVPLRWSGFHFCLAKNPAFNLLKGLILKIIPKDMRRITRFHLGTSIECEYSLRGFGIPTEDIPRTCTGKIKTKGLAKWVRVRTAIDDHRRMMAQNNYNAYYSMPPSVRVFPGIECPEINCVLFRLAGLASTHPGNVEFRLFLQEKDGEREQLKTRKQKDDHLHQIIEEVTQRGLRFLQYDENRHWYNEITDYKILRKHVFQAQRDIAKRAKAHASMQLAKSNTNVFTSLDGLPLSSCDQDCGTTKKKKRSK